MKHLIVFTDCGDTLVDESKQVFDLQNRELVLRAELIPGAYEELCELKERGFRTAMVADGLTASFDNIVHQHQLETFFETRAISEAVGCNKPCQEMFLEAMRQMGLTTEDCARIVMVGNHLKRDIIGANRMGICSVLLTFSPRYSMTPETDEEQPDYTISMPCELVPLLEKLEEQYLKTGTIKGENVDVNL